MVNSTKWTKKTTKMQSAGLVQSRVSALRTRCFDVRATIPHDRTNGNCRQILPTHAAVGGILTGLIWILEAKAAAWAVYT
jgi:hypothetical protein